MRRWGVLALVCLVLVLGITGTALAKPDPATIQSGNILYSAGHYFAGMPIQVGFDAFGYNYQGHMFAGSYANSYLGGDGLPPYDGDAAAYLVAHPGAGLKWYWPDRDVTLAMKWNDAWLANTDRDGDGKLDRHYGFASYLGSGAWLTNHQSGVYPTGERWNYFVKIAAAPMDAVKTAGVWYAPDGTEIGPAIWGDFAVIQEISNDPVAGNSRYISPSGPGLGKW